VTTTVEPLPSTSPAVDGAASGPARAVARTPLMADPMPMAYGLFGFALAAFAVRFIPVDAATLASSSTSVALTYAVLVAGIAEAGAGVLGVIRGMGYPAYVTSTFGIWLIGFYLLGTAGAHDKAFTANALAWYVLLLLVPVVIMAVPAAVHRNYPFIVAFVAIIAALLFVGLGYHDVYTSATGALQNKTAPSFSAAVDLIRISGWSALVAALALWFVFAKEIYNVTGVLTRGGRADAH
jgi:hypothetical protein